MSSSSQSDNCESNDELSEVEQIKKMIAQKQKRVSQHLDGVNKQIESLKELPMYENVKAHHKSDVLLKSKDQFKI